TGAALGLQPSLEVLTERVEQLARAGYRRIKLKIGPGADLEPLRAARAALSKAHSKTNDPNDHRVGLMADANSAYTLADVEHLARFDALDLMMIEQPLAWDDLRHHAELQRRLSTPICLDESLTHCARVDDMLHFGSGRIVNLKPGRVGGLAESLAIHDLCRRHDVPLWCGGMLESGIGRAYNVALASLPGFNLPGDLSPSAHYWERDIVEPEWTMDARGRIAVPRGTAGLGVAVDVDRIDDLTVRQETLTAARAAQTSR
ncbi:MAG: o-succinylbenzoate synthase, partial [Acidobacteriota bacterium]